MDYPLLVWIHSFIAHVFVGDAETLPTSGLDGCFRQILPDREPEPHKTPAPPDSWRTTDGTGRSQYLLRYPPEGV